MDDTTYIHTYILPDTILDSACVNVPIDHDECVGWRRFEREHVPILSIGWVKVSYSKWNQLHSELTRLLFRKLLCDATLALRKQGMLAVGCVFLYVK